MQELVKDDKRVASAPDGAKRKDVAVVSVRRVDGKERKGDVSHTTADIVAQPLQSPDPSFSGGGTFVYACWYARWA